MPVSYHIPDENAAAEGYAPTEHPPRRGTGTRGRLPAEHGSGAPRPLGPTAPGSPGPRCRGPLAGSCTRLGSCRFAGLFLRQFYDPPAPTRCTDRRANRTATSREHKLIPAGRARARGAGAAVKRAARPRRRLAVAGSATLPTRDFLSSLIRVHGPKSPHYEAGLGRVALLLFVPGMPRARPLPRPRAGVSRVAEPPGTAQLRTWRRPAQWAARVLSQATV